MTEGFLAEAEMTPGFHYQGPPQHRWGFTEAGTGNRGHSAQSAGSSTDGRASLPND